MDKLKSKLAVAAAGFLVLAGCETVQQTSDLEPAGFLDESVYAKLEETNDPYRAGMGYANPNLDYSQYTKILLDPVITYADQDETGYLNTEDAQLLSNNFHALIARELSKDYELVSIPQPNTLRFKVALVQAEKKNVTLGTISTVVPAALAATQLASYVTGKPAFTGRIKIEFELRDATTRELVGAGIDSRAGGKVLVKDQFDGWSDVNNAMEIYAVGMRYRLCLMRGGSNCQKPVIY